MNLPIPQVYYKQTIAEIVSYRSLIANLVFRDLKLKYRASVLGFLWSLLNPLVMLTIYTIAFTYVLRIDMEDYGYFLMLGLLTWNFFAASAVGSTNVITGNANLIKKVHFPAETLPIASVLFGFAQLLLALVVFLPALTLISEVPIRWTAVLFIPLVLLHFLFTLGLAFMLSALTTSFRDVVHLTEVSLQLLFWMTPIIYPVAMAPPALQMFFKASPVAAFAIAYREVLFLGNVPDVTIVAGVVGWTVAMLVIGHAVFRWYSPTFAEEI
jgi:ABC-2 type transport system permease protein